MNATVNISIKGNPHLDKQVTFALASALTFVAKEAQTASLKSIRENFQVRTNWDQPWSPFGIRIKPATKNNLTATVGTAAGWLEKFSENQSGYIVHLPQGKFLAIPTSNVRRSKRDLILKSLRPNALRGKRDVLLPMREGGGFVLFQRRGRGPKGFLVALYILKPLAKIKQRDVLFGPTRQVFERRFADIFEERLKVAFATAR
jgi:hypothetical protein